MARIRSIKPELLTDEKVAALPHEAWRLFVSLILMADDYGNLRANAKQVNAAAFWAVDGDTNAREDLAHLHNVGLIRLYSVRGQTYAHILGWEKHQKVDHPSKPTCPGPQDADPSTQSASSAVPREPLANDARESRETLAPDLIGSDLSRKGGESPPSPREEDPAAPEGEDPEEDLQLPARPAGMRADELLWALRVAVEKAHPELSFYAPGPLAAKEAREFLESLAPDRPAEARTLILARIEAFAKRRDVAKDGWTVKAFVRAFNTLATPARDPERPPKLVIPPNYPRPRQATRNA